MSERDERGLLALILALVLLTHACYTPRGSSAANMSLGHEISLGHETHVGTGVPPFVWIEYWAAPAVLCLRGNLAWSESAGWECVEQ